MDKKILVIDDEPSVLKLLVFVLKKEHEVIAKPDGLAAFNWIQEGNLPDVIVSDIQMPNMNGYEFLQQLKSSGFFKDIPILMLSGLENSEERIKCLSLGADDYLVKPFNPKELSLKIQILLKRSNSFYNA